MAESVLEGMISMDAADKIVVIPGVAEIGLEMQRFQWPDYVMFVVMLLLCMCVGLFYGFFRASTNTQDYLMGGRNMPIFPVSMSLIASFVSGISILGIPTEAYVYGIQYIYILPGFVFMALLTNYLYLPVFFDMQLTSTFEYHERRFNKKVRFFGSILFIINLTSWLPIVIYVPALAFNQVTGVNIHYITPAVCCICIFYTSLGGLKAVVWTDVIQAIIMFSAMVLVAVKGTLDVGGFGMVWQRNWDSGRIERPNLDLNPLSRHTLWSLMFGGSIYFLQSAAVNQSMVQRYLSLPTLKSARLAVWIFVIGMFVIVTVCVYTGILMYAAFYKCDPLTTSLAKEKDQLLPLLVMDVLGNYPGLPGIFVAGVLSAALSSLSTGLNSMAAVVLEDFYKPLTNKPLTEKQNSLIMKLTVIIFGAVCVGLVFVVEKLGMVLQLTMTLGAIASGPALGLFTMGILLPWINAKGALIGGGSALAFMSWLGLRAQAAIATGDLSFPEKPLSTEGCHYHFIPKDSPTVNIHFNASFVNIADVTHTEEQFIFYHLSYMWYALIGVFVSVIVGLVASFLTKPNDPRDLDPILLAPCIRKFIKPREYPNEPGGDRIIYAYGTNQKPAVLAMKSLNEPE